MARLGRLVVRTVLSVAALGAIGATTVYVLSSRRLGAQRAVPAHALAVGTDSATVAHGRHLARTRGCTDCHGQDLAGTVFIDDPAMGRLVGTNLTPGGPLAGAGAEAWERAIRHGVGHDGRALVFMPSHEFAGMSDEDVAAIVAYARALPATRTTLPAVAVGPMLRALYVGGQLNVIAADSIDHGRAHVARVAAEPTVAYGRYLAQGCTGCHGKGFSGGAIPGAPPEWLPASNLTPAALGSWSANDFAIALREGKRPDGSAIRAPMPIAATKELSDVEIAALQAYLRTVPARESGTR